MQRNVMRVVLTVGVFTSTLWAYSGGSGTTEAPYQIATPEDLIELGGDPNNYDKHFILTADIDLSGYAFDNAVIAPYLGPEFSGSFNGQGHVISHLSIQGLFCLGLFGTCSSGAVISNLGLEFVDINGLASYIGGLVGYNDNGTITSSYSIGTIRGGHHVGGLVGRNDGTITSSYGIGIIGGDTYVGGLVGKNDNGTITSSYSTGTVNGNSSVGGFVGYNAYGTITLSYSASSVAGYDDTGGLVGANDYGTVTLSFWDIETSGWARSDGGIGLTTTEMMDAEMLGLNGLASDPNWILDPGRDYPRLAWEGTAGERIPEPVIDWLDGSGTAEDPYQIANVSQLQLISTASMLADRCFELVDSLDLAGLAWPQAVIPYFDGCFDGNGYSLSHLVIEGENHLGLFGTLGPNAKVLALGLEEVNIKGSKLYIGGLAGENSGKITLSYSTGTISGGDNTGGLVGWNYYGAIITSCYSTGTVSGDSYVGGLVGRNGYGAIVSCYSTGTVSGDWYVGGLVGYNDDDGMIMSSYSTGTVSGSEYVGGLAGKNYEGRIASSYSTGTVSGTDHIGGLAGGNKGTIKSSFWDIETSSQTTSTGGTGLTTAEMQLTATYINADWDLKGETTHGTCDFWLVEEGTYPRLTRLPGDNPLDPNGSGTPEDPYRLIDANDLGTVWYRPDACYRLESDIDLAGITWNNAVVPEFAGYFDGNGHVIRNLQINGGRHLGLFGICLSETTISNLGLDTVDIIGNGTFVGGLVGENRGTIMSCYSTGNVSGYWSVGGLLGYSFGTITSCHSSGSVRGNRCVGGLVGLNGYGDIMSCYSTGTVRGYWSVGGLVGENDLGTITSSYSTGSVSGDWDVGGLVGVHWSDMIYSNLGSGTSSNESGVNWFGPITSCYSTGTVSGDRRVGGLVGYSFGTITLCYSSGSVSGDDYVGGLVGQNDKGTIASSFWNVETSGQSDNTGGTGLTTAQMLDINIFLDAGWDFIGEMTNGTEDTWFMPAGSPPGLTWCQESYTTVPDVLGMTEQQAKDTLLAQGLCVSIIHQFVDTVSGEYVISQDYEGGQEILIGTPVSLVVAFAIEGSGTEEDPYRIDNARRLITLGEIPSFYDKHFILTADIDLSGYAFKRAVIAPDVNDDDSGYQGNEFTGSFDGQGYVISHLNIKGTDYLGLFGCCASDTSIANLGLEAVDVNSIGEQVGGLVGNNSGTITSCYSTGTVGGDYNNYYYYSFSSIGGLVGDNSGTITSSYSTGSVSGDYHVGGLVGWNDKGTIMSSYSTGTVRGTTNVGGLVGRNYSYQGRSTIYVYYGTITSSFWDIETSGQPASDGGTGLTTAEMQTVGTFLDAGWDFFGESENGPNDVWKIAEDLDYPRLGWEPYDGQVTVELGQTFPVTLESNPSTGYSWEWIDDPNTIVEQVGQAEFIPRETDDPFTIGAGGWEVFTFQAARPGQTTLELVYRRAWEEGVEPLKTFFLHVTVP